MHSENVYVVNNIGTVLLCVYYFTNARTVPVVVNGITTKFHSNGNISYRGSFKNGKKDSKGISYSSKGDIVFKGEFNNGSRKKGTLYKEGEKCFEGSFLNGKPYDGEAINLNINNKVINFTGDLKEGYPFRGKGHTFKRNHLGETEY